jgi:glutathione peroxidase
MAKATGGPRISVTRRLFSGVAFAVAMGGYYGERLIGGAAAAPARSTGMSAFDFEFVSIEGEKLPLRQFAGRPLLVVNTASFCGYTPQYTELEALWNAYKDKGLVLLGVPSDDFGRQEPGTNAEIKAFCEGFDVSFPMAEKNVVAGAGAHPFYRWIAQAMGEGATPRWNFFKHLFGRDGQPVASWPSRVGPMSPEIRKAVEAALAANPGA